MKRARGLLVGVAATLTASACASTVQSTGTQAGAASLVQGGLPVPGGTTTTDDGLSIPGVQQGSTPINGGDVAGDGQAIPGAATTTPGSAVGPGSAVPSAAVDVQGVGVTPTTIFVGVTFLTNGDAANAALGASGVTTGDEKADAKALVADINAHGGVAGRRLVPVYHGYDANSTSPYAVQDQAACADFTQDNHVFAVLGYGYTDDFTACVTKAGALQIDQGELIYPDAGFFRQYPAYFNIGTLTQDRMMGAEVASLVRQHYFSGWNTATGSPGAAPTKVGVLGFDAPEWSRPIKSVLLPGLARAGHRVDPQDVQLVPFPDSTAGNGQVAAQIQNAALRFRQHGVTHVVMLDTTGGLTLLFAEGTRNQRYYPRLGINSATGLQALAGEGLFDAKQINGALGLGWAPFIDLPAQEGNKYATATTRHCLDVMKKRSGQTYDSTNAASLALGYCDQFYSFAEALRHVGPVINQTTGVAAYEGLHDSYTPADLPAMFLGPGRHDGAQLAYDMKWDSECSCVRYVSKGREVL